MNINESVMHDFRNGDLESLYTEIYPSLLRYAVRVLGENHAFMAEDCVQESIFKLYQSRKEFDSPLQMKSFLFTCVHNEIVNLFRKDTRHTNYLNHKKQIMGGNGEPEWVEDDFISQYVLQETLDRLYAFIDALPEPLHQFFELSFEKGMKNKEIAELLKLSPETIKKRKAKLVSTLRDHFKDDLLVLFIIHSSFLGS
ncbi:MAG: sigma-70 family RNA polymerase sigma factor [Prevotella sp.]|nr:sigma-70 family RNA polymerase sigma factor [Prevotella sp.]